MTVQAITDGKFDRKVELVLSRDGKTHGVTLNRIDFNVEKFPGLIDNRATITVYNLGFKLRNLLTKRRLDLRVAPFTDVYLSAGHLTDDTVGMIFRGVVIDGANSRVGPDWVTTFEAMTSIEQTANAYASTEKQTYLETAPLTIINDLFSVLNFNNVRYSDEALEEINKQEKVTQAFTGRAIDSIHRFLVQFGLSFTLEDDGPVVVLAGSASNPNQSVSNIPTISAETGLVGTPRITHRGVEIKTILNKDLRIFRRFQLQSLTTDGSLKLEDQEFTCVQLRHFGSNRQEDFFTELRGAFYPRLGFNTSVPESPRPFVAPAGL